jgi:signal transduction histidine kinase
MNVIEFPARRAEVEYVEEDALLQAERLRIARELHDVIASSFSTIKVHTGVALHLMDGAPEQLVHLVHAIDSASKEALDELREILGMLRGGDARAAAPGVDRLDGLVARMTAAGLRTRLVVSGEIRSLPGAVSLTVFRVAQESLSNALQHEGATSAVVTLVYELDGVTIEVENDKSEHPVDPCSGSGHGIAGMRERVQAVGGDVEVGSRPEGGFRVFARLPLFPRSS